MSQPANSDIGNHAVDNPGQGNHVGSDGLSIRSEEKVAGGAQPAKVEKPPSPAIPNPPRRVVSQTSIAQSVLLQEVLIENVPE